jgi:uncharacterized protein YbjT (DUF2867 family)
MAITMQAEGRRIYLLGDTYAVRERLREAGAHWDAERKAWWIGSQGREAMERIVQSAPAATPAAGQQASQAPRDGEKSVVAGRATYKGRTYYVAGRAIRGRTRYDDGVEIVGTRDGVKVLLYSRDGTMQFWAAREAVQMEKRYDRPQTIAGLRDFARQAKQRRELTGEDVEQDRGWVGNGCSECRRLQDWCPRCAFDEFDM